MSPFAQDIRYSLRMLTRTPVVTAVAVVSLALGIGANTAIFSLMNALVMRPLPVRDADRLVRISTTTAPTDPDQDEGLSLAMMRQLRNEGNVFSDLFSWGLTIDNLEANGAKYVGGLATVDGEYFPGTGIRPYLGRLITPEDLSLDAGYPSAVAVISYGCWQRRYSGDPGVLGKTIRVRDRPLTIIGVTPPNFSGLYIDGDTDVSVPVGFSGKTVYRDRKRLGFEVQAHLSHGVTLEQARVRIDSVWPRILEEALPEGYAGARRENFLAHRIRIEPFSSGQSFLRQRFMQPLNVLMAMVGLLLLIACVNLANLMLARAAGRGHEFGIRMALGASRWPLIRQLLTESLILSLSGAALGIVLAFWASRFVAGLMWTGLVALSLDPTPDWRVLLFTIVISVLTGVGFGLAPAWGILKADPAGSLRQNSRGVRGGGASRVSRLLIIAQVALSIVLVMGAVLFARSLDKLRTADVGYRRDGLAMLLLLPQWDPNGPALPNRTAYYRELAERVTQLPGVESASFSEGAPMFLRDFTEPTHVSGSPVPAVPAVNDVVAPGFFHLAGMRLLAGRDFEWRDDENAPKVAIVSESLARRLFPAGDAIGKTIDGGDRKGMEVVGIVNSASLWSGRSHEPMAVYSSLMQNPRDNSPSLDIRTTNAATVLPSARRLLQSMGRHVSIKEETMEQRVDRFLATDRLIAMLSSFFGGLALLLASIGLYGLMSYAVERRTSEIGVRIALGARPGRVLALILEDVLWLVGFGLAIGIPAAWGASRLVSGMVFGVAVDDASTVLVSSSILIAVAAVAGYVPARRASLIDPMVALRAE